MKAAINMRYRRTLRYEPLEDRRLLATVTVTTLADTIDLNDGLTSLREAIFATNLVAGPDTIQFAPSPTASGPATILLSLGELAISDDLSISGPGTGSLTIDATASDPTPDQRNGDGSRVFHIDDGSHTSLINVSIEGLTLTGGDALNRGGAILNRENLSLVASKVIDSVAISGAAAVLSVGGGIAHSVGKLIVASSVIEGNAADFGGGIHIESGTVIVDRSIIATNTSSSGSGIYIAGGTAEVYSSWIHDNSAGAFSLGGGIYNSGNLRVDATTISGNSAAFGAGIFSRTDTAAGEATRIINSTISGNIAFDRGGGVRNAAGLTSIEHSTITENKAPPGDGGGVASRGYANTRTEVRSTVIAGNTNSDVDFATGEINTFVSLGYNIVGTGNAAAEFNAAGDRTGIVDPLLGPLVDNGGPTLPDGSKLLTHALLPGSSAINAGDLNAKAGDGVVPLYDQRGEPFVRIANGRIDIGAIEFEEPSDLNLVVDTLADESDGDFSIGDLSLREAIGLANVWPSTDTIRFDPALTAGGPVTILLTMGELKITDDIAIVGPGAEFITIDAGGNDPTPDIDDGKGSRLFYFSRDKTGALIDASIAGLSLTGGDFGSIGQSGGAIFSLTNLTITASTISGNAARFGGAIDHQGGTLTITNSTISGNSAGLDGGAIWSSAAVTITRSTISGNTAGRSGGGLLGVLGIKTISDSTFTGNTAQEYGGAIGLRDGGALIVANSTISENAVSRGAGGGIRARAVNVTVTDSTISGNSANLGGGMAIYGGTFTVTNSTISNNSATGGATTATRWPGQGGGIFGQLEQPAINGTTIIGNSALESGGGISGLAGRSPWMVTNSTISGNTAGRDGGGIQGNVTLTNSTVSSNTAGRNGGGVATSFGPGSNFFNSTLSGNTAGALGGGIWTSSSTIDHTTIVNNEASVAGGGVFASANQLTLRHTIVAANFAFMGPDLTGLLGVTISPQFSLIGNNGSSGLAPAPSGAPDLNGNIIGGVAPNNINPRLGPLAHNGGPTSTHVLMPGSPAVDAGDPAAMAGMGTVPPADQRGEPFTRVFGGRIDIGAFEAQPNPLAGDYNFNGVVDAADYALWRETRGSTTDLRADGNGDGVVDDADRTVWRANFARTAASVGQGARSEAFVAAAVAPKPPALPAGDSCVPLLSLVDESFTPLRRRAVGSRLTAPSAVHREAEAAGSLLNAIALQQAVRHEPFEFPVQLSNATHEARHDVEHTHAAVLDHVFEALGAL